MSGFAFRSLLLLGQLAVIAGGLAFGLTYILLIYLAGFDHRKALTAATPIGLAAGTVGWWLDAKYGFTAGRYRDLWVAEQNSAKSDYQSGVMSYQQALVKYYNAAYNLVVLYK